MKLNQILIQANQFERSKFINCLDRICTTAKDGDPELAKRLEAFDGQLKLASEAQVAQLFVACVDRFRDFVRHELSLQGGQVALLVNILARDGNCLAREVWIEQLYAKEHARMIAISESIRKEIEETENLADLGKRGSRLYLYERCFRTAYTNDLIGNREAKISDDERTVLGTLGDGLGLSSDERFAIEHSVVPIPQKGVADSLGILRDIGIVILNKRTNEVLVPDEVVAVLHQIQGRVLSDKLYLRILRALTDPELALVLRSHGQAWRGVDRSAKIQSILHSGVSVHSLLANEIHKEDVTAQQKKDRALALMEELDLKSQKKGTTLSERIDIIVSTLKESIDLEFDALSASGFKELIDSLADTVPDIFTRLRKQFEIEENEQLDTERLRARPGRIIPRLAASEYCSSTAPFPPVFLQTAVVLRHQGAVL